MGYNHKQYMKNVNPNEKNQIANGMRGIMLDSKLYSIGQFAKMCDVTIKQLRYLEDKGVLLPQTYNVENNYRYYSKSQMEVLIYLKTLRDMGVPFKEIDKVIHNPDLETSIGVLMNHLEYLDDQMKNLMYTYRQCTALMTQIIKQQDNLIRMSCNKEINSSEVSILEVPAHKVVYTRYGTKINASDLFFDRLIELKKICQSHNIVPHESMHAIFHDGYMKQFDGIWGDLEIFFPINSPVEQGDHIKEMPEIKGISCIHKGHYENIRVSYEVLEKWAEENNIALSKKSIEIYLLGPDTTIFPEQYLTRIIIPLIEYQL
jgi:effector-binding domain-containing protein